MKKKSKVKLIFDIVTYAFVVLILLCAFVFLSFAITSQRDTKVPSIFGVSVLTVQSDSMKGSKDDNFNKGDLITIKRLTIEEIEAVGTLQVGDVITFEFYDPVLKGKAFNTHRIVEIGEAYGRVVFTTKGDNNLKNDDEKVAGVDVIGIYTGHIGGVGAFIDFLRSGFGFFLLIVFPLILFFAYRLYILIKVIFDIKIEKQKALVPATDSDFDELEAQRDKLLQERIRLEKELAEYRARTNRPGGGSSGDPD